MVQFMFMTQMGVEPYNEDRTATNLMSAGAVEAYTFMTDFFKRVQKLTTIQSLLLLYGRLGTTGLITFTALI